MPSMWATHLITHQIWLDFVQWLGVDSMTVGLKTGGDFNIIEPRHAIMCLREINYVMRYDVVKSDVIISHRA